MDVEKVYNACSRAVKRARDGKGPSLIECVTMRMRGHAEHDDASYVPKELLDKWKKKDPILLCEKRLLEINAVTQEDLQLIHSEIEKEIRAAADAALALPPIQPKEEVSKVFAE